MHEKLKEIIAQKQKEVAALKRNGIPETTAEIPPLRDFRKAISKPDRINLISEIKFASPSAGRIKEECDPVEIGVTYEKSGASAISFLTDRLFFKGDINNLPLVKKAVTLPVLRKDFIADEIQVREALVFGADAVLLITRILQATQLKELLQQCRELGLDALTEVHDMADLELSLECGAEIIGINNRDLDTFNVDLAVTERLSGSVPESCVLVSESGIFNASDIKILKGKGINAVLVGSALMSSGDAGEKVKELVEAGI